MERQQSQKEKSLAWFKLADLIARGEREKALSVFRLLSHSLSDRAYVLQLEGDMLWHLEDKNFVEKYKQAAFLFQKEKRWVDAIAIYEHIFSQSPDSYETISKLMILYAMIDWHEKFNERYKVLLQMFNDSTINELQLEKSIKDIVDIVLEINSEAKNQWFSQWFSTMLSDVPESLSQRLSGLCKVD